MSLPFHLGLRHRRHMVSLIRSDSGSRVSDVLGVAYPQDMNPRLRILEQWGMSQASPRRAMQATVDIPLPRRHQVALTSQLNPDIQSSLRGGFTGQPIGRLETMPGVKARMHLGSERSPLDSGLPPGRGGQMAAAPIKKPGRGAR